MTTKLVPTDNYDPNKTKNRIPTNRERQFLIESIAIEEKKLVQIGLEIQTLNIELANFRRAVQEYESMLLIAHDLLRHTEANFKAIRDVYQSLTYLMKRSESQSTLESPQRMIYDQMLKDRGDLEVRHANSLSVAEEDLSRASKRVYELEAELEASKSMLAFLLRAISFQTHLKLRIQEELQPMKDLIGARRRVPEEIWAEIFRERLEEDEDHFLRSNREGIPPFTIFKLSWVCKFWRTVAHHHPILWRYIAIPRASEVSPYQHDRFMFCLSLTKRCPPFVYVVPDSRGEPGSNLRIQQLLKQVERFAKLELRISRRNSEAEDLLAAIQPTVEQLILVGTFKPGCPGTSCPLKHRAFTHAHQVTFIHVQPLVRSSSPQPEIIDLTSVKFVQDDMDARGIISFLESLPIIEEVHVNVLSRFVIKEDASRPSVILPGIKRITADLEVLHSLFPQEVMLPELEEINIQSSAKHVAMDGEELWRGFLAIHSRFATIKSLKMGILLLTSNIFNISKAYGRVIQQLPNLRSLHLVDTAAHHTLRGVILINHVPMSLQNISLFSDSVKEEDVSAFLQWIRTSQKGQPEIRLVRCPAISEDSKERLAKLHIA